MMNTQDILAHSFYSVTESLHRVLMGQCKLVRMVVFWKHIDAINILVNFCVSVFIWRGRHSLTWHVMALAMCLCLFSKLPVQRVYIWKAYVSIIDSCCLYSSSIHRFGHDSGQLKVGLKTCPWKLWHYFSYINGLM